MIKFCSGARLSRRHLWAEIYIRIPGHRTWFGGWTWGLGRPYAYVIDEPFRAYTGRL
jgi:hypothetical protein